VVALPEERFEFMFAGEFLLPPVGIVSGGGEQASILSEGL
jgi:hypothetical protein